MIRLPLTICPVPPIVFVGVAVIVAVANVVLENCCCCCVFDSANDDCFDDIISNLFGLYCSTWTIVGVGFTMVNDDAETVCIDVDFGVDISGNVAGDKTIVFVTIGVDVWMLTIDDEESVELWWWRLGRVIVVVGMHTVADADVICWGGCIVWIRVMPTGTEDIFCKS